MSQSQWSVIIIKIMTFQGRSSLFHNVCVSLTDMLPKVETRVVVVGAASRNASLLKALQVQRFSINLECPLVAMKVTSLHLCHRHCLLFIWLVGHDIAILKVDLDMSVFKHYISGSRPFSACDPILASQTSGDPSLRFSVSFRIRKN